MGRWSATAKQWERKKDIFNNCSQVANPLGNLRELSSSTYIIKIQPNYPVLTVITEKGERSKDKWSYDKKLQVSFIRETFRNEACSCIAIIRLKQSPKITRLLVEPISIPLFPKADSIICSSSQPIQPAAHYKQEKVLPKGEPVLKIPPSLITAQQGCLSEEHELRCQCWGEGR